MASVYVLAGCDKGPWWQGLAYGKAIPDARLEVTLPKPASKYELYLRLKTIAELAGYPILKGPPRPKEIFGPEYSPYTKTFNWKSSDGSPQYPHRIAFMYEPYDVVEPQRFTFILYHVRTDGFTAQEWRYFYDWKDRYLPQVFPEAEIKITRHPAVKTDFEDLLSVSEETNIPIPDKVMKKYEVWLSKNS